MDPLLISSTAIFTASAHSRPSDENLGPRRAAGDQHLIPAPEHPTSTPSLATPGILPGALNGTWLCPVAKICVLSQAQGEEPAQHIVPLHSELSGQAQRSPHPKAQESREAQESQT